MKNLQCGLDFCVAQQCSNAETMNKLISTKSRVFMSMVGPSESGKTQLIYEWLTNVTFQPKFDKIYSFYQYYQSLYDKMQKEIDCVEFVQGVNFELIDSLKINATKYLLIFDDSCVQFQIICRNCHCWKPP